MQSQYRIKLSNLSPKLASASNLSLPIFGQETVEIAETVKIQSVDPFIHMLSTKTRPKRVAFVGSDGIKYNFLYKGQEDLRVDQHISNLFSICNSMFEKINRQDPFLPYFIHCYNVIPLGPRSGLIQWVENCSSIYFIYRRWRAAKVCRLSLERNILNVIVESISNQKGGPDRKKSKSR